MKMKLMVFCASLLLAISCSGQDVCCYSQKQYDSLLSAKNAEIILIETDLNQALNALNVTSNQNIALQNQVANLKSIINTFANPTDTLLYTNDTITLRLASDSVSVIIAKIGERFNYQITDGLQRIDLWYYKGAWEQWFMNDKKSVQHFTGKIK